MEKQFTKTDRWGETYVDQVAFMRALATPLSATIKIPETAATERYATATLILPSGLQLFAHELHGANKGRLEIMTGTDHAATTKISGSVPKFPRISVDVQRDIAAIVRDVTRRLIEPSAEPFAKVQELVALAEQRTKGLIEVSAELSRKFPALQITTNESSASSATVYGNVDGTYFSGRVQSDGSVYVDRISTLSAGQAERVFSALFGEVQGVQWISDLKTAGYSVASLSPEGFYGWTRSDASSGFKFLTEGDAWSDARRQDAARRRRARD